MKNIFDIFEERAFIEQVTDRKLVCEHLKEPITCYIGFDPTADSLHLGSLVPIMALAHMQRAGHRPIAVVGGGTALVGDPSGKTEMRPIMKREEIDKWIIGESLPNEKNVDAIEIANGIWKDIN